MNRIFTILILAVLISSVFSISAAYAAVPNAPQNLHQEGASTTTTIPLVWSAPVGGAVPDDYRIEGALETPGNSPAFGSFIQLDTTGNTDTSITLTGLTAGSYYKFRVIAVNGEGPGSPSFTFNAGTPFGAGKDYSSEEQAFDEKGTFSEFYTLPARTSTTTEFYDVFTDLGITSVEGKDGGKYPHNTVLWVGLSTVTAGNQDNDILFTDGNGNGIIDCVSAAACELADMTTATSYPSGSVITFDYEEETSFTSGAQFSEGQSFAKGQNFDAKMDFKAGAMNFESGTQFNAVQDFDEAGAFSGEKTLPVRTIQTKEWFDVFTDLKINNVTGYDKATLTDVKPYTSGIIYSDFSAVTAGSDWNDILFTDGNNNGKIDCASPATCELADMAQAVTYANLATVHFDKIEPMNFKSGNAFVQGQIFGSGQDFGELMDFSKGPMNFGIGNDFTAIQAFDEAGAFSGELSTFRERTSATKEWADVFTDLGTYGIVRVNGTDHAGLASANYTTGTILFADFSAVNGGQQYNDILFTDNNDNQKIDCASAAACELQDMYQAVTYASGTTVRFDYNAPMDFNSGNIFMPGQPFGPGQDFDKIMDFSKGAMNFAKDTKFDVIQNFDEAGAFSGDKTLPVRTIQTKEWADVFADLSITSVTGYDKTTQSVVESYATNKIIYSDFSAVTAGSDWNDILFTDGNNNGKIDCASPATCELADMAQAVTYANGATVHFDYVIPQVFGGQDVLYQAGQSFGPGQGFGFPMDFSKGGMNFGNANDFTAIQSFDEAGTFSNTTAIPALDVRTTATVKWADIFDDLGPIAFINGTTGDGQNVANYTTGTILYADFSAVNAGSQYNDILFTDKNSDGVIDCATDDNTCELADLSSPVTYEAGTTVSFNHILTQNFGASQIFMAGQPFAQGQNFDEVQDFSKGAMVFAPGVKFAPGQNFENQDDFIKPNLGYGALSVFPSAETYGMGADFSNGTVTLPGSNSYGEGAKFAPGQVFAAAQFFNGSNTFGAGMEFGAVQNFGGIFEESGDLPLDALSTGTTDWYTVLQALETPAVKVEALDKVFSEGVVYADFSAVTFGSAINDVTFTDANDDGIIDCTGTADNLCELADLSSPVTFAADATVSFGQDSIQTFGLNTEFATGTSFANEQVFSDVMEFAPGMVFAPGVMFAEGQTFAGQDDFTHKNLDFGSGSTFDEAMSFGNAGNFTAGPQTFNGTNTFGEGTLFADSQPFAAVQLFNGSNTFGDAVTFAANQDFSDLETTTGDLTFDNPIATLEVDFHDLLGNTTGNPTKVAGTVDTFETGTVYANFGSVLAGSQINAVTFTDNNNNGIIDCVSDAACELSDLPAGDEVLVANGATISFTQDPVQTFGAGTVFATGTLFANEQSFNTTQTFGSNATFAPGMEFADSQSFPSQDNFNFKGITFGNTTDFDSAVTFGDDGNFTAGVQLFDGTNTFGDDSLFADAQTFAAAQIFNGTNTFGAGTVFASGQNFTVAGTVASTSVSIGNGAITDQASQDTAFGSINATSGIFEDGLVTLTFASVGAGEDVIQEVLFTDNNSDGIIDDGELGVIGDTITASTSTMTVTQSKTQDFDAGAQTFGTGVIFNENQSFGEDVQTFGTGTTFNGNANFTAAQTFAADITFDDGQDLSELTDAGALNGTGITFGNATSIDFGATAKTFGASATFAENQNFTGNVNHILNATDLTFKKGTLFLADGSEEFGEHVTFAGVIEIPNGQEFSNGAEFADDQSFSVADAPVFANFTTFGNATSFAGALDFKDAPNFEGTATFTGANTFGAGTEFETGVTFTEAQTFSGAVDFGVADLSAAIQTIQDGSQFELGSTFKSGQSLPSGTVLSEGLLLGVTTCTVADCIPAAADDILTKGEKLAAGVTIPAIKNTISKDNPTMSVDGLGISVNFTSVTADGNLDVTVQDPAVTASNTGATLADDGSGALEFTASGKSITTISSVIDFDLTGSTASSGAMTITLPYDEANIPAGVAEGDLNMVHYVGGQWVTENNCTVDTVNNKITCTVTSLSPFGIGAGPSSGGGGSSGDTLSPSFTTTFSEDDYPLRISGVGYSLVMTENIPTQTIKTGETIQIELMMYENSGPQNVQHVDMYVNQNGDRILNDNLETIITYDSDQMQLQDPLNLIQSANVISSVLGNKAQFLFDVSFSKAIDTSDILFRMWDTNRNAAYLHIPGALQVIESGDVSNTDTVSTNDDSVLSAPADSSFSDVFDQWAGYSTTNMSDTDFLNQLGMDGEQIPKWFKQNNAKWFKDGLISQNDITKSLNNLNNRGII